MTLYTGERPRGSNGAWFQSLPPLRTIKLGPSSVDSPVGGLVHALGPCGSLQQPLLWGWECLLLPPQPPQVFSFRGLRLYFPILEIWVVQSVLLPCSSSWFICARVWGLGSASCRTACPIPQSTISRGPPATALLGVLSDPAALLCPSYRSGWIFLLYLLGCRTSMQFDFMSVLVVLFFFLILDVLLLVVRGGTVCLPMPPSWPEAQQMRTTFAFIKIYSYTSLCLHSVNPLKQTIYLINMLAATSVWTVLQA